MSQRKAVLYGRAWSRSLLPIGRPANRTMSMATKTLRPFMSPATLMHPDGMISGNGSLATIFRSMVLSNWFLPKDHLESLSNLAIYWPTPETEFPLLSELMEVHYFVINGEGMA